MVILQGKPHELRSAGFRGKAAFRRKIKLKTFLDGEA